MSRNIVLKIGGSVFYNSSLNLNLDLLSSVKDWYSTSRNVYQKIAMVVGGGSLSRDIQNKIKDSVGGEEYLHSIAMSATQTNASIFHGYMEDPNIFLPKKLGDAYEYLWEDGNLTLISGGLRIGWSTDMDAAIFADVLNTKKVYKISDIDYLYDSDPKVNNNSKEIKDISWDAYYDLFDIDENAEHYANGHVPIDVECARFCNAKGISFFITGGSKISKMSIDEMLSDGTLIHS